ASIEHCRKKVIAEVIVLLAVVESEPLSLQIEQRFLQPPRQRRSSDAQATGKISAQAALKELIDCAAIPPAIDITFADAGHALTEYPRKQPIIVDVDIPRPIAVDDDIRRFQGLAHTLTHQVSHGKHPVC